MASGTYDLAWGSSSVGFLPSWATINSNPASYFSPSRQRAAKQLIGLAYASEKAAENSKSGKPLEQIDSDGK